MSTLIGSYGYVASGSSVVSCGDPQFDWQEAGWWHTYLWCANEASETVVLKSPDGGATMEVAKKDYNPLGWPVRHVGDPIIVKNSGKGAVVDAVCWHTKRQRFYYLLDYGERKSSNWFFDEDLEEG